MSTKIDQVHAIDKQVSILQHQVTEIQKLVINFTDKLESLFSTQTEILNSSMPEFNRTVQKVEQINIRVNKIEKRHEIEDYREARRAKWFDLSLKNWKVLVSIVILFGGLYEAGRSLYLAPSPKYNIHSGDKK